MTREQIVALAHSQAKAYFHYMEIPTWTAQYQHEYPLFVENFVREYTKRVRRDKNKKTTDNK